jgi:ABC-type amino acid transport substrate-binding protein
MDEERIERALRQGPPDEPAYQRSIAASVRVDPADAPGAFGADTAYRGVVRRAGVAPQFRFATVAVAAVVLIAATILVRPFLSVGPGSSTPLDLLGSLRAEGSIRIAVTGDHPQTTAAGGAVIGFDVDVARQLARSLGLESEVSVVPATDIIDGTGGDWDIGLPSRGPPVGSGVTAGPAYYAWPSWLVTDANSGIATPAELDGATICGVVGTAGLEWLRGESASEDAQIEPPTGVTTLERANDAECVAAVLSGQAAAAVTAQLLDDELSGQGLRALTEDPVVQERRVIVVPGSGSGIATLLTALDEILRDAPTSRALSDASRRAFGGRDLTEGIP